MPRDPRTPLPCGTMPLTHTADARLHEPVYVLHCGSCGVRYLGEYGEPILWTASMLAKASSYLDTWDRWHLAEHGGTQVPVCQSCRDHVVCGACDEWIGAYEPHTHTDDDAFHDACLPEEGRTDDH